MSKAVCWALGVLLSLCQPAVQAQNGSWQVTADMQMEGSRGLPMASQWLSRDWSHTLRPQWFTASGSLGMSRTSGDEVWRIERRQAMWARADDGAAYLAALSSRKRSLEWPQGRVIEVAARVVTLDATALSWTHHWHTTPGWDWRLSPELMVIHGFEQKEFHARLSRVGELASLSGTYDRLGTHSYGFLSEDRPDAGWGWGLHGQVRWQGAWGQAQAQASNLLSGLQFSNVHDSRRQYQVNQDAKGWVMSDVPAISGNYGQEQAMVRLPVAWQAHWQPVWTPHERSNMTLGVAGLGGKASPTFAMGTQAAGMQWSVRTVAGRQWQWGLASAGEHGLQWGVSLANTWPTSRWAVAGVHLRWAW